MRLHKQITDDILRLTDSEPAELLTWFKQIYEHCRNKEFPCESRLYLEKWSIATTSREESRVTNFRWGDQMVLIITMKKRRKSIYQFWEWVRESDQNYYRALNQFRKMYNLKW